MEKTVHISDLQLILLPGKCPPSDFSEAYLKAYECWRSVWEEAYQKELNHHEYLHSDDFTRQDEVAALYYQGECAALCFYKWIDLDELPVKHDSYFKKWPETALFKLGTEGKRVLVCSQFTLHFNFRKNYLGLSWKDLFMGLIVKRFMHSDRDAMTGTMRLQKGMGEATYRTGAIPLVKNMEFSSSEVTVDLVAFYQSKVTDSVVPGIATIVDQVFEKTISLSKPIIIRNKEVKRAA